MPKLARVPRGFFHHTTRMRSLILLGLLAASAQKVDHAAKMQQTIGSAKIVRMPCEAQSGRTDGLVRVCWPGGARRGIRHGAVEA